jgi:hypothetical protein
MFNVERSMLEVKILRVSSFLRGKKKVVSVVNGQLTVSGTFFKIAKLNLQ